MFDLQENQGRGIVRRLWPLASSSAFLHRALHVPDQDGLIARGRSQDDAAASQGDRNVEERPVVGSSIIPVACSGIGARSRGERAERFTGWIGRQAANDKLDRWPRRRDHGPGRFDFLA